MMLVLVLGTMVAFSSCSKDDDENNSVQPITVSSLENTLWRAETTFATPMIGQDFVSAEIDETRVFFGTQGNALMSMKYKSVDNITGYEQGEIINYCKYQVNDNKLTLIVYKDNGTVESTQELQMINGKLSNANYKINKVRPFNSSDHEYFDNKMLYYGPDSTRFDFELSTTMQAAGNGWNNVSGTIYERNINFAFLVKSDQKLYERGFTEVVAKLTIISKNTEREEVKVSVNPSADTKGSYYFPIRKYSLTSYVRIMVSYEVWDHKENRYRSTNISKTYEF